VIQEKSFVMTGILLYFLFGTAGKKGLADKQDACSG
jgi:hypothetical protein